MPKSQVQRNDYLDAQFVKNVYRKHSLEAEKVALFRDFLVNLNRRINDTYLGPESLTCLEEVDGHFLWAFNTTSDLFYKHGFDFRKNKDLYLKLRVVYMKEFYGKEGKANCDLRKFWLSVMRYEPEMRDKTEITTQVNFYRIMSQQLF